MVQISQPWGGTLIGDAVRAPYGAAEWDDMFEGMFNSDANRGVLVDRANELVGTIPGANTFRIATGEALVKGKWYKNDANVDFTVPNAGAGNWRRDRIVLSSTWNDINSAARDPAIQNAQTIRLIRLINPVENAVAPAVTQNDEVLWELSLYRIQVTDAGVVTIHADDRLFAGSTSRTRQVLLPCCGGRNGGDIILRDARGINLADGADSYAYGIYMLPTDFRGGLRTRAVVVPAGTGDLWHAQYLDIGACGEAYNAYNTSLALAAWAVTDALNNCHGWWSGFGTRAPGDIIRLTFRRNATVGNDTVNADAYFTGWIIEYESDS